MDHIPSLKQYHPSIDCPCGEILEDVTKNREREKEKKKERVALEGREEGERLDRTF